MKFGVAIFATEYSMHIAEVAQATEQRGLESLFLPEHTHIPTSRRSPWRGGEELPVEYSHTLDPFVALGAAATATRTLLLGTGVTLVAQRDPILLAKEVATLDVLSGGRVLFGIGGGWNIEEMSHHGTDPATRWKLMRERIYAMKQIWTNDIAEFHGEFVDFDPMWQWPKPVQKPHPPILVGGNASGTLRRVLDYGDGWMPLGRSGPSALRPQIEALRRQAAQQNVTGPTVTVFGASPDRKVVDELTDLGVERCLLWLPTAGPDVVLPALDHIAGLAATS